MTSDDDHKKDLAIRRMMLLNGITLSVGGIPLLYLGEEWGMLNEYDFVKDPAKAGDTRWIHRPKMKWEYLEELDDHIESGNGSIRKRIFTSTQKMIALRKSLPALGGQNMELMPTGNCACAGICTCAGRASVDCAGQLLRTCAARQRESSAHRWIWSLF